MILSLTQNFQGSIPETSHPIRTLPDQRSLLKTLAICVLLLRYLLFPSFRASGLCLISSFVTLQRRWVLAVRQTYLGVDLHVQARTLWEVKNHSPWTQGNGGGSRIKFNCPLTLGEFDDNPTWRAPDKLVTTKKEREHWNGIMNMVLCTCSFLSSSLFSPRLHSSFDIRSRFYRWSTKS